MRRHEFVGEFSAESPYCGALVMRNGDGDTCGQYADDSIHGPRYDQYTRILLNDPDAAPLPLEAHLCVDCGAVVVDTAVHDEFHERIEK